MDEVCDGIDNDCNDLIDDGVGDLYYADNDGDSYGGSDSQTSCIQPDGYVLTNDDCDDTAPWIHPYATEICDGIDNDCDPNTEDGSDDATIGGTCTTGLPGVCATGTGMCVPPGFHENMDDEAHFSLAESWNFDSSFAVQESNSTKWLISAEEHPEAVGTFTYRARFRMVDNDQIYLVWNYQDADNYNSLQLNGDHDQTSANWHEHVEGDERVSLYYRNNGSETWFPKFYDITWSDNDILTAVIEVNGTDTTAWIINETQNKTDLVFSHKILPVTTAGRFAVRTNSLQDAELYSISFAGATGCEPDHQPGELVEVCDTIDNDCDTLIDEDLPSIAYCRDADEDTYGDPLNTSSVCDALPIPVGYIADCSDCNDSLVSVNPAATEQIANNSDDNCDGLELCFLDADHDSHPVNPDEGGTVVSNDLLCTAIGESGPPQTGQFDCVDDNPFIYPGASEICDGLDNDCDGEIDEGFESLGEHIHQPGDGPNCTGGPSVPVDRPDGGSSRDLQSLFDEEYVENGNLDSFIDGNIIPETYLPATGTLTFHWLIEWAGYNNTFGWYNVGDDVTDRSNLHEVFNCELEPPQTYELNLFDSNDPANTDHWDSRWNGGPIGFFLITPQGAPHGNCADTNNVGYTFFTERSLNEDSGTSGDCEDFSYVHYIAYASVEHTPAFYFAFEDLNRGGDNDFTDFVARVEGIVGEGAWYADLDGDGHGDPGNVIVQCTQPPGHVADFGDCDDDNPYVYTGHPEICDFVDNDCDTFIDANDSDVNPTNDIIGRACDAENDADFCADNVMICRDNDDTGLGELVCDGGAESILRFNNELAAPLNWSGGNANAFYVGDVTQTNESQYGHGAARINQELNTTNNGALRVELSEGNADFTIMAWINPAVSGTRYFFDRAGSTLLQDVSDALSLGVDGHVSYAGIDLGVVLPPLATNAWTHVAITMRDGVLTGYHNGVVQASAPIGWESVVRNWDQNLWIGQHLDENDEFIAGQYFIGDIDDLQWFDHGLAIEEITETMITGVRRYDVNHDFCDGRDNACTGGIVDADYPNVGEICDGDDSDACQDGRIVCDLNSGIETTCANGATAIFPYDHEIEGANFALDNSANNHHGIPQSSIAFVEHNGRQAAELAFEGGIATGGFYLPSTATPNAAFSFATWVKPTQTGDRYIFSMESAFSQSVDDCDGQGFALTQAGDLYFNCQHNEPVNSGMKLAHNQWQHVAVTFNGGQVRGYLDGTERFAYDPCNSALSETVPNDCQDHIRHTDWISKLYVGDLGPMTSSNNSLVGYLDDTIIYDRALSANEIHDLMNAIPENEINYEFCDENDNDCINGIDDPFQGTTLGSLDTICYNGQGDCQQPGPYICNDDMFSTFCSAVEDLSLATTELCDSADHDCNGVPDVDAFGNAITTECYTGSTGTEGVGECHSGLRICGEIEGIIQFGDCGGQQVDRPEQCDILDHDCEGNPNNMPLPNYGEDFNCLVDGAVGICEIGYPMCRINDASDGTYDECVPTTLPDEETEVCDLLDNDCDGFTNETDDDDSVLLSENCYTGPTGTEGVGVCHGGNLWCTQGVYGGPNHICDGQVIPSDSHEICGDDLDNNCDGFVDEYCPILEILSFENSVASGCDLHGSPGFDADDGVREYPGECTRVVIRIGYTDSPNGNVGPEAILSLDRFVSTNLTVPLLSNTVMVDGEPHIGTEIGVNITPGSFEELSLCWINEEPFSAATIRANLDLRWDDGSVIHDNHGVANAIMCGAEICDGYDNDGNLYIEGEHGEPSGCDVTQVCSTVPIDCHTDDDCGIGSTCHRVDTGICPSSGVTCYLDGTGEPCPVTSPITFEACELDDQNQGTCFTCSFN